ncbi:unnamed protein product [Phytophthora fragariaefolia]|uniref:Unnamed protein product n=1 Tax=Phytophthora fragariaefolia TaxID=1490495 RepID=A0A9W6Y2Z5_9STRA|nr:unnamed protein product [Phytophthora fragariaefolia]
MSLSVKVSEEAVMCGANWPRADDESQRVKNSAEPVSEPKELKEAFRRVQETDDHLIELPVLLTKKGDDHSRVRDDAMNSAEPVVGVHAAPRVERRGDPPDQGRQTQEIDVNDDRLDVDPATYLHHRYLLAAKVENDEEDEGEPSEHDDVYKRVPNSLAVEDYAHGLASLPDVTDVIPTRLYYSADNVGCSAHAEFQSTRLTKFDANLAESDPMQDFIDSPSADIFTTGETDQSSWVPVFEERSFVDDIGFGGRTLNECLNTLDRFAECRISVGFTKSIFAQPKVDFLSHKVTPEGIQAGPKKITAIAELPFPKTKKYMQTLLGARKYYGQFIQNLAVFQKFSETTQSRSRVALNYRLHANGQQERSVKSMIQTVRTYVEDPLQVDRDDIGENLVHATNNSRDSMGQETPFYLVHEGDARPTLKAMTESIRQEDMSSAETTDAFEWRREANRHREVAIYLVAEFQRKAKPRRAETPNEALSRVEKIAVTVGVESLVKSAITEEPPATSETPEDPSVDSPAEAKRSLFKEGDQVWLFMERVKPGLPKKLAHRWHGPFRVKKKFEEFTYELELPDKSGYRFYLVRFEFDKEFLSEDCREPGEDEDKYEGEAILDDELPLSTSTARAQRTFMVKWVGYDEPSWEPLSNLLCGSLLFDYFRNKKRENHLQMVQLVDEN